jgi:hypothetical protein
MNDFTKEELLIILLDIESLNSNPNPKVQVTINKIKSMIDNYCEHSHEGYTIKNIRCKKCKADIRYQ